ncbi:MAG: PKD domain-containing protein, partial [Anaerolineales bacterium]|nr:PKD domain-containing protein [Anaerolineales bacterium]
HLGYGMATGPSMAAPQVAGGAVLLRQIHPDWSQRDIQSALMTTAKFRHVYNPDGSPAQPLDMGAGRLDLSRSADPGVLVWPPRLSFGFVPSGTMASLTVTVRSVADTPQTYALGWLDTRGGFPGHPTLPGFSVSPESLALGVGDTAVVTITFSSTQTSLGDQQGYLLLTSDSHEAHLPAWARVLSPAQANPPADVLLIDNDGSTRYGKIDYVNIYTQTLSNLGLSYTLLDADTALANGASDTLDEIELAAYPAVVYFSGDNNALDSFPIADRYRLNEFAAHGGTLLVTGQDARRTLFGIGAVHWLGGGVRDFVYWFTLAAPYQATSLTDNQLLPTLVITPSGRVPFTHTVELGTAGDGAGNQRSVDVLQAYAQPDAATLWHGPLTTQGVGTVHRQQPSLERAGVTWHGRVVYFSFGLEGVNNDTGHMSREALLWQVWRWGTDSPTAVLQTTPVTSQTVQFTAVVSNSATDIAQYRWDMGDGTPIFTTTTAVVSHAYGSCRPAGYTARVEVQNEWGNTAVAGQSGLVTCVVEPTPTPTFTPSPTPSATPSPTPSATPSPTPTATPTGTPPPPVVYRVLLPAVVR